MVNGDSILRLSDNAVVQTKSFYSARQEADALAGSLKVQNAFVSLVLPKGRKYIT